MSSFYNLLAEIGYILQDIIYIYFNKKKKVKIFFFNKASFLLNHLFNPIKTDIPGSHDSLAGGQFVPPPPIYFHYIGI